jgi:rhamnose utilization protein RhaD (predicted bifunctional aldolase and dehydrogenase)
MSGAAWRPELTSPELLALTRLLGEPARDLVVLAEGNTSELLDGGRLVVKASGAGLADATADDFVVIDVDDVMAVVRDGQATQRDLSAALLVSGTERPAGAGPRRGSIETVVHAAVHAVAREHGVASTRFVGHTHPTEVVGLLASVRAESAWAQILYSDEAVVIGQPLFVPYATPGIELGRVYLRELDRYVREQGRLPQLVLLANHGIVALAPTPAGIEGVSTMAVKGARVRASAYAVGGPRGLTDEQVRKFFDREDISERRANLSRGR